jgi:hypothetical protein
MAFAVAEVGDDRGGPRRGNRQGLAGRLLAQGQGFDEVQVIGEGGLARGAVSMKQEAAVRERKRPPMAAADARFQRLDPFIAIQPGRKAAAQFHVRGRKARVPGGLLYSVVEDSSLRQEFLQYLQMVFPGAGLTASCHGPARRRRPSTVGLTCIDMTGNTSYRQ